MNNTVINKSELVIDALQYAHDHNFDVANKEDVRKILEVLDLEHKEDLDAFAELLKTSDVFMGMEAKKIDDKKPNLVN